MSRNLVIMAAVAVLAAAGGYFVAMKFAPVQQGAIGAPVTPEVSTDRHVEDLLGRRRPDFVLSDSAGSAISADDFNGRVWLVNFWATWCAPCVEEMPMLAGLRQRFAGQGVEVVGIALADPEKAKAFAEGLGIHYPILVGQTDVMLVGRRYGNRSGMLPYSVLIDADGIVRWVRLGALEPDALTQQVEALLGG